MIYLDNSATTRPCSEAGGGHDKSVDRNWQSQRSVRFRHPRRPGAAPARRRHVAAAMGAEPIPGVILHLRRHGSRQLGRVRHREAHGQGRGKHIVTTAIEHHAILNCMKRSESPGFSVTYLQPDSLGRISVDALKAALRKDTILVSAAMVNNEAGSVMPIQQSGVADPPALPRRNFSTLTRCRGLPESPLREDAGRGPDLRFFP